MSMLDIGSPPFCQGARQRRQKNPWLNFQRTRNYDRNVFLEFKKVKHFFVKI